MLICSPLLYDYMYRLSTKIKRFNNNLNYLFANLWL